MTKSILILAACAPLALLAQSGASTGPGVARWMTARGQGGPILGKPLSGTETFQKTQVLADGTHLESSGTGQFNRDDKGRMRSGSTGFTVVYDAVTGSTFSFPPNAKMYRQMPPTPDAVWVWIVGMPNGAATGLSYDKTQNTQTATDLLHIDGAESAVTVALPAQTVNGVWANGTRITVNLPAGAAGNNQAIQIVREQWYSPELDVMLQRTTSDPRYGTATYNLTGVQQGPQDPALFQIPADYTPLPAGNRTSVVKK